MSAPARPATAGSSTPIVVGDDRVLRMLHAKTAAFDDRIAIIGSHNLDTISWRFNLECNVVVEDAAFATVVRESFDADCADARPVRLAEWRRQSRFARTVAWLVALLRPLL